MFENIIHTIARMVTNYQFGIDIFDQSFHMGLFEYFKYLRVLEYNENFIVNAIIFIAFVLAAIVAAYLIVNCIINHFEVKEEA